MEKMIKNNKIIAKKSNSFNNLIKEFMSDSFVLTEKNIRKFLNKLHGLDYELEYSNLYTVETINDIVLGGYINHQMQLIAISVNHILNISKNASKETVDRYKLDILVSYFHETRHEVQLMETYKFLNGKTNSAFSQILCSEYLDKRLTYDPFNTFMEIDARLCSILKIMELEGKGVYKFSPASLYPIMLSLVQMLDGLNQIGGEITELNYSKGPFEPYKLLERITNNYFPFALRVKLVNYATLDFRNKYLQEFDEKFTRFFKNEYIVLMQRMFGDRDLSMSTKLALFFNQKIRLFDKDDTQKLIDEMCFNPNRDIMQYLNIEMSSMAKDENDVTATQNDFVEFLQEKGIEFSKEEEMKFADDHNAHVEFEKWLRKKYKKDNINNKKQSKIEKIKSIFSKKKNQKVEKEDEENEREFNVTINSHLTK